MKKETIYIDYLTINTLQLICLVFYELAYSLHKKKKYFCFFEKCFQFHFDGLNSQKNLVFRVRNYHLNVITSKYLPHNVPN